MSKHIHYCYSFGESFSRRTVEDFGDIKLAKCRSTKDQLLIGGAQDYCIFVAKQEVKYAASRPSQYQTPRVINAEENLVPSKTFITKANVNKLIDFTVHVDMDGDTEQQGTSRKRIKIELTGEPSKNELFCSTLREMLHVEGLIVDSGLIDETPPMYSPFHRSRTDLYMYSKDYCTRGTQGIITSGCVTSEERDDEDGNADNIDETMLTIAGSVWEMKNDNNAKKQFFANMIHIGSQLTVKALKQGEIVDIMIVYGLALNYDKRKGRLYKLKVDFNLTTTVIENFGQLELDDAVNIIVEKITKRLLVLDNEQ